MSSGSDDFLSEGKTSDSYARCAHSARGTDLPGVPGPLATRAIYFRWWAMKNSMKSAKEKLGKGGLEAE